MKISVIEYSPGIRLAEMFTSSEIADIQAGIEQANKRIAHQLQSKRDNTLKISDGYLRALGVAGVIQLTNKVELEVIPKFLHSQRKNDWKAPLYLLATLSKHGSILTTERITASSSYLNSLYEIAGRILSQEYQKCKRKPIRQYRKEKFRDYAIDGEIELSKVFERHPDGIEQSRIRFDRMNPYNATIQEAMRVVQPFTTDLQVKNVLSRAISEFGNQGYPSSNKLVVPARNKEWEQIYDLSYDIIHGLGTSYDAGRFVAPGFVVDTWQLWEWLITTGVKIGNQNRVVLAQNNTKWGFKETNTTRYTINVFPDIEVREKNSTYTPLYLVDAKYKLLANPATGEVSRSDLYEAFAFCKATSTHEIVLVYPDDKSTELPGTVRKCSTYYVHDIMVHVAQASFGSIREKGGILDFSENLSRGIDSLLQSS